jgi:hypothetical protein
MRHVKVRSRDLAAGEPLGRLIDRAVALDADP